MASLYSNEWQTRLDQMGRGEVSSIAATFLVVEDASNVPPINAPKAPADGYLPRYASRSHEFCFYAEENTLLQRMSTLAR